MLRVITVGVSHARMSPNVLKQGKHSYKLLQSAISLPRKYMVQADKEVDLSRHDITVYVLHLQQNKLYVGRTSNIKQREQEIFSLKKNVPAFVQKYPPMSIAAMFLHCDAYDEDKITKIMMASFGIENVRGGSYSSVELSAEDRISIRKEIYNACSVCFICGSADHWAARCPRKP